MARVATEQAKLVPQNVEAERAVLGACLIDPDATARLHDLRLAASDFWVVAHQYIWQAAQDLNRDRSAIDVLLIANALKERRNGHGDQLAAIGGESALFDLVKAAMESGTANVAAYGAIVKDCSKRRQVLSYAGDVARLVYEHEGDTAGLLGDILSRAMQLSDTGSSETHLRGGEAALLALLDDMQATRERLEKDPHALIQTGLRDIDNAIGDLPPGFFTVIGALPGVGKTMLMEQIAEYNARHGHKVTLYHLELPHKTMLMRAVARHSGNPPVTLKELRRGVYDQRFDEAYKQLKHWHENITFVQCEDWTAERIAADIKLQVARGRCEVALVDYLQMLPMPDSKGKVQAALIGEQANAIKQVATTAEVPIVLGTQLNRSSRARGGRPDMHDIRNSGEPGEKANIVIILDRETEREKQDRDKPEVLNFYIDKNTQGDYSEGKVLHVKGRYLIADLDDRAGPEPANDWWSDN